VIVSCTFLSEFIFVVLHSCFCILVQMLVIFVTAIVLSIDIIRNLISGKHITSILL